MSDNKLVEIDHVREKLIELLESAESAFYWNSNDKGFVEKIADHLISNGVTVQKWIPVSERLPDNDYWVLCLKYDGDYWVAAWNYIDWMWSDQNEWYAEKDITHWMPLPEPPSGGDAVNA